MIKFFTKLFFEPLLYFLLVGGLIYLYYASVTKSASLSKQNIIKLQASELERIERAYEKKYNHPIKHELLYAYMLREFYNRVLLQEAYRLELDKQDTQIAKILLTKMHAILQNSAPFEEPSEKQLYDYYRNHIQEYSKVKHLSFTHIFFADGEDETLQDIYEMLHMLDISPEVGVGLSEVFEGKNRMSGASYEDVAQEFGKYFASKLFALQSKKWSHPIHSKYGKHLVYVEQKEVAEPYAFESVQDRVYRDFLEDNRSRVVDMAYKDILKSYALQVEK